METQKAYIITGPTSGIGYKAALELARYGTVILVARNAGKLQQVVHTIESAGHKAIPVICDVSDMHSVRKAAQQITGLNLHLAGLLNNAGVMYTRPTKEKSAQGWDLTFATNYLGAFALTEALMPHLPDGGRVLFVGSAIEDPERKPAKMMGMKGARYLSVAAGAMGQWKPGGSKMPGIDAYATSKLCVLAAAMALSRENRRLHINVVEPGINPGTGLGARDTHVLMRLIAGMVLRLPPFARYRSTPEKCARVISTILTGIPGATGIYYDEKGRPMNGSEQARDMAFQDRVAAETRALLATV